MSNVLNDLALLSYDLKIKTQNASNRLDNEDKKEKLEEFSSWTASFAESMDALSDLGGIVLLIYKFKKTVRNNITEDFENIAALSKMIIDFTDKYKIITLIIKADLINLFEQFIEYADSIADFKQLKDYSSDSIFPIIISALKKSYHFIPVIKSSKHYSNHFVDVNKMV